MSKRQSPAEMRVEIAELKRRIAGAVSRLELLCATIGMPADDVAAGTLIDIRRALELLSWEANP